MDAGPALRSTGSPGTAGAGGAIPWVQPRPGDPARLTEADIRTNVPYGDPARAGAEWDIAGRRPGSGTFPTRSRMYAPKHFAKTVPGAPPGRGPSVRSGGADHLRK